MRTRAREAEAYFADTMLALPPELVLRRDKLHLLPRDAEGAADLGRLLEQKRLRGAYARGRSFGDMIDALLAAQQKNKNPMLADYATFAWGDRMRDMLAKDRTDYLIDAPGALAQLQRLGLAAEDYVSLPIHGATEPLVLGIACPAQPLGPRRHPGHRPGPRQPNRRRPAARDHQGLAQRGGSRTPSATARAVLPASQQAPEPRLRSRRLRSRPKALPPRPPPPRCHRRRPT